MAAKAAFSQAPGAQSGPDGENPNDGENTNSSNDGIPNPRPLNPGLHGVGQDPGATHPHLISAAPRPLFYFQAPPPPPFLPYQWPMPFYNPFSSFPGYGMMMPPFGPPPFNPPPYMEAPAYILPHPPVQPVDYRRVVHPHPNAASSQNPIQTRRSRLPPPQTTQIRQTVNSEVQTDPTPRSRRRGFTGGSPLRSCSDSGRETVLTSPTSPTSSTSSNQMKLSDGESYNRSEGLQLHISCTTSAVKPHPAERETTQKPLGKENCVVDSPSLKKIHSNSRLEQNCPETEAPVKPSEKEQRLSVPDILMSWTPQKDEMAAEKTDNLSLYEDEMEPVKYKSPTGINKEQPEAQSVDEKESDKEETEEMVDSKMNDDGYEHSLNISIKLCNHTRDEETPEQPTESSRSQISSSQFKRKLNESVWSVESLPVFIPTKEWLMQNVTSSGPDVILETAEEAENDEVTKERKKSRSSSTDSVQMSDSFLGFSTPNKMGAQQMDSLKMRKNVTPLASPTSKQSNLTATVAKALDINESEPGGNSPNRRSFTIDKEQETSPVTKKGQPLNLECEKPSSVGQGTEDCGNNQLSVPQPINSLMEVSPSKRHLVDCGVQCPDLQENMETANTRCFNSSDLPSTSYGKPEGYGTNRNGQKKRHGHWRNKGQDRPQSHQEAFDSYCGKPGKPRGGRNRY